MKDLNKEKAYDLQYLNDEQLEELRLKFLEQGATSVFNNVRYANFIEGETVVFNDYIFKNKWSITESTTNEIIDARELFEEEWTPKQGEKVLVSDDLEDWRERVFVIKYQDYYWCEGYNGLHKWKHIKPLPTLKIGDKVEVEVTEENIEVLKNLTN